MNKSPRTDPIKLSKFLEDRLRKGSIAFTKSEAIKSLACSDLAFMRAAQRHQKKGQLLRPVTGFYVIIEVEFRDAGGPPPVHFLSKLMEYLDLPYYVGLLSAAKYQGATHQAVFETQVFTIKPLRTIKYGKHRIRFIKNKFTNKIPKKPIQTPHGEILISSPEATLVDLIRFSNKAAGLSHAATVMLEIKDRINSRKLTALAEIHNDTPLIQRVGYVLNKIGGKSADSLQHWLKNREPRIVKLEPSLKVGPKSDPKWSININTAIEPDEI